ncbi:hypothetical protein HMPREF9065_00207 [Aggregatibacter sp. oral taxon 458 str. W10330]|nr:hypothetical protein HMPREF9065_00207 [Aggregatibacter sp. oral taxon 458 str. W10330]
MKNTSKNHRTLFRSVRGLVVHQDAHYQKIINRSVQLVARNE